MAGNGWKWLEWTGNGLKWLEIAVLDVNDWKQLDIAEKGWE